MRIPGIAPLLAATAALAFGGVASAQKTTLLVYTALETDQLKAYQEGFNKVEPNIEIKWVRDSTGVDHRQAAGRKRQSAGRRGDGRGRLEPGAARQERHARAVPAAQRSTRS